MLNLLVICKNLLQKYKKMLETATLALKYFKIFENLCNFAK